MTPPAVRASEQKRTDETRLVESRLREHFDTVDCYRYNPASIRVRVVDRRIVGMSREQRDSLVEEHLVALPIETQQDIVTLFVFAPSELTDGAGALRELVRNAAFEAPSPATL